MTIAPSVFARYPKHESERQRSWRWLKLHAGRHDKVYALTRECMRPFFPENEGPASAAFLFFDLSGSIAVVYLDRCIKALNCSRRQDASLADAPVRWHEQSERSRAAIGKRFTWSAKARPVGALLKTLQKEAMA